MEGLFEWVFGNSSKPVRRRALFRATVDAEGQPTIEPVEGESISLSPEGSIDSATIRTDQFYHCGCDARTPMGGRCAEPGCRRVSCARCFGRCAACKSSLCLEHSRFLEPGSVQSVRLCRACYEALMRKRLIVAVVQVALSPFVAIEKGPDE